LDNKMLMLDIQTGDLLSPDKMLIFESDSFANKMPSNEMPNDRVSLIKIICDHLSSETI
jgi:hypothetical protein